MQDRIHRRIVHKHDTEENWIKAKNFIPLKGELIIYDVDENNTYERMKIGDGVFNADTGLMEGTNVNDLPFVDGGIGAETPEGGEIFNDYKNNAAIGEGTSARGLNTQAGNLAFKILSIDGVIKNISEYKSWAYPFTEWTKAQGENISGVTYIVDIRDMSYNGLASTEINTSDLVNAFPKT
jgi:hypothetical protein